MKMASARYRARSEWTERPKYKKREYCPRTLTHEITKEIDKWLKENERRRSMGMRKQCLKRQDSNLNLKLRRLVSYPLDDKNFFYLTVQRYGGKI